MPLIDTIAKYQKGLIFINGIGAQVKNTVTNKKNLRPQISDNAPTNGAARNDNMPLIPTISPFIRKVCSGNVVFNTLIMGLVKRPHAKNSKNITTKA